MRRWFGSIWLLAAVSAFGAFGSCASPTQIVLHLHTDVPCTGERWKGVSVSVGKPDGSLEGKAPAVSTMQCNAAGDIGTVVVTPSGSRDEEVGLRIVAGLDRIPEQCNEFGYTGCVVARRAVRFDRNSTLHVDVALARSCIDFGCTEGNSTCIDGVCKPLNQVPNTPPEGNAGSGGGAATTSTRVRCGDNGLFCDVAGDQVCCVTIDRAAGTSAGQCVLDEQCPTSSVVLRCDDEGDCSALTDARGRPGQCILAYRNVANSGNTVTPEVVNASGCFPYAHLDEFWGEQKLALCNDRSVCANHDAPCLTSGREGSPLPNYNWCIVQGSPPDAGPPPEKTPSVRCGDSGLLCAPTGDVCCLTVDTATQTSTGECRPAADCPEGSIPLHCDDQSDCPGEAAANGLPGVCALMYSHAQGDTFNPSAISSSLCMTFEAYSKQYDLALGLCDRSALCLNHFACNASKGEPNLLPGYNWCIVQASEL